MKRINDQHFDSVRQLIACEPSEANKTRSCYTTAEWMTLSSVSRWERRGRSWYGTDSVEEVVRLTKQGWPTGLRRMRESVKAVSIKGVGSVRRKRVNGPFGDSLDMQRVWSGSIDKAWGTTVRETRDGVGRYVSNLLVNVVASGSRYAEQLFWRGAAAVALADALEASGRSVRIVGFRAHSEAFQRVGYGVETMQSFLIKQPSERLDLEKVAVTLGLAGFYRVWLWRAGAAPDDIVASGIGCPTHFSSGKLEDDGKLSQQLRDIVRGEPTIVVDGIWTQSAAQSFVNEMAASYQARRADLVRA